jgi:hypothetical protein
MFEEIDNLQSQINKLTRLCADTLPPPFDSTPNSFSDRNRERLGVFILKLLDGVLAPRILIRLEKWLLADSNARRYYVDFMTLTTLLQIYYNPGQFKLPKITELSHP